MYKMLLSALIAIVPMLCEAQSNIEASIKIKAEIGIDDLNNNSFGADFIIGYKASKLFKIGFGTGISHFDLTFEREGYNYLLDMHDNGYRETGAYIPIFLHTKMNFTRDGISPYLSLDLGNSFLIPSSEYAKNVDLGVFVSPSFGVDFPINKGKIFTQIGYKHQNMSSEYVRYEIDYSQIAISVGYIF